MRDMVAGFVLVWKLERMHHGESRLKLSMKCRLRAQIRGVIGRGGVMVIPDIYKMQEEGP